MVLFYTLKKALIALACAVAVKCKYCIKAHKKRAQEEGCTREEILEAAAVAGQVRLGWIYFCILLAGRIIIKNQRI